MKGTYLNEILEITKTAISKRKKTFPLTTLESFSEDPRAIRGFRNELINSLEKNSISVIAEMKKASPSQGLIRERYEPQILAKLYKDADASCLSVLTDEPYFHGSLDHLSLVRETVELPLLRKDFIVDTYQIYESLYYGADCILLIVAALTQNQLHDYYQLANELKLDVLVELHTYKELERALKIEPSIVGINNRNLETFKVNLSTTKYLVKEIPDKVLVVSESGIKTRKDINKITSYGVNIFLVGEVFMKSHNPGQKLKDLFFPL